MAEKLYEKMDWARIEGIVYSEENAPREVLGAQVTKDGTLIQCFYPGAKKVTVKTQKNEYFMEKEDEEGFFAVLIPEKVIPEYQYIIEIGDEIKKCYDPYTFSNQISEKEEALFQAGLYYESYKKLGAHVMTLDGISGVYFAVWAPNAIRVSVVGDFNQWDGRIYQMNRLHTGIYELFIPEIEEGALYKYEIKLKNGDIYLKADPYANGAELRPATASVIENLNSYVWADAAWMKERAKKQQKESPISIYEMHLGSWKKIQNCRELAVEVAKYVQEMGYTHVELMPVMEHYLDESWGYQTTGYYAFTRRYGSPEDFMYFVDTLHQAGIGVILDWVPSHFPRDSFGLERFDGTCLYEYEDSRKGFHPDWGTLVFNYASPYVRNFLISNALFWLKEYHIDGIRMDSVASMLYLDYGRGTGEWIPNIYGGNENLEAVEFLKTLNSQIKKEIPEVMIIAEDSSLWPMVTSSVEEEGLGFDYKWNTGWKNDFIGYMRYDPLYRGAHHEELTMSMVYAYSEKFLLSLSHNEFVHGRSSLYGKMPGNKKQKYANIRTAIAFMMTHPGKKMIFMGQDLGVEDEWFWNETLSWETLENENIVGTHEFMKNLLRVYREQPALWKMDYDAEGFEWINFLEAEKNLLIFLRKTKKKEESLLVVCNFSGVSYEKYQVGVPYAGKYKEIFNSDNSEYGGTGFINPRVKMSKKEECDERKNSIVINIAALSVSVFSYTKAVEKIVDNKRARIKRAGKSTLKKELEQKIEKN